MLCDHAAVRWLRRNGWWLAAITFGITAADELTGSRWAASLSSFYTGLWLTLVAWQWRVPGRVTSELFTKLSFRFVTGLFVTYLVQDAIEGSSDWTIGMHAFCLLYFLTVGIFGYARRRDVTTDNPPIGFQR